MAKQKGLCSGKGGGCAWKRGDVQFSDNELRGQGRVENEREGAVAQGKEKYFMGGGEEPGQIGKTEVLEGTIPESSERRGLNRGDAIGKGEGV